ncbi:MAG: MBL fold metallo-hydrolase [Elusimicrobiaceae bacterium]|nr:MBL fold metallo-hydrolase [Elusimicrobiaceae bacterium]
MKIIALKYYDGGFMTQPFAFGGSRDKAKCDPKITYPSSLQNFLIDDGKDIILSDTGLPCQTADIPRKEGASLWMGDKVATFAQALDKAGYKPQDITKIFITHKHPDHTGELRMFPKAKIYISKTEAEAMKLTGDNIVPVEFTDGPYKNFPKSQRITDNLVLVQAIGHTKGNLIGILEDKDVYYMFHGDVTYSDAALKENELSVIFEDKEEARQTLERVRQFIKNNPTIYCSTHCPEGYLNIEQKKIMKL